MNNFKYFRILTKSFKIKKLKFFKILLFSSRIYFCRKFYKLFVNKLTYFKRLKFFKGVGAFVFAPFTKMLLEMFDWKITMVIMSGLMLQCCVLGALLKPVDKKKDNKVM